MKSFYVRFISVYLLAVAVFSGCAALQKHSEIVGLIVSQATSRYIENHVPAERPIVAARVIKVATEVETFASGQSVSVAELAQLAIAAIPSSLSLADRQLALAIVQVAVQELQNKIGSNILTADQTMSVKQLLEAVKLAASAYVAQVET